MGNDVYDMISRHKGKYVVSSIWIYKNKYTKQGSWFASERIDYDMTYSIESWPVYIKHRTTCTECRGKMILHFRGSDYRRYLSSTPRIILGANFSPMGYFSMFFSKKDSPFCIFWSLVSPNFDGVKIFYPKNREIII